ncbi:hypothetical protein GCM10007894_25580 [Paraferrimonas haliotis]|uniref:Uncharacterized protein n=2 Tax=Paraferrimonas haliotis TaxID=2013866 RepID=A0AA37U0W3_9GAMM|nr:hypothetical protein GCM10007894_25580 [Paraferrimonas haliotis]
MSVSLMTSPTEMPSEEMVTYHLEFSTPVTRVRGKLEGRDMFMGSIPILFSRKEGNHFDSEAQFGACISGYMVWRLTVNFETQSGPQQVYFDFLADSDQHQ